MDPKQSLEEVVEAYVFYDPSKKDKLILDVEKSFGAIQALAFRLEQLVNSYQEKRDLRDIRANVYETQGKKAAAFKAKIDKLADYFENNFVKEHPTDYML